MVDEIAETFRRIDILVNNAGVTKDALLHKMTEEMWDRVIDVNLKGTFNVTQPEQISGKIIVACSVFDGYVTRVG